MRRYLINLKDPLLSRRVALRSNVPRMSGVVTVQRRRFPKHTAANGGGENKSRHFK